MFLQREDPLIPVLHNEINAFLKKLFSRFIKVAAIQDVNEDIVSIDYGCEESQLPGKGLTMKQYVKLLHYFVCRCFPFCWNYDTPIAYEIATRW